MGTVVTPELLQALLSPNGTIRSHAEAVYHTVTVVDRITGLVPLITTATMPSSSALSMLAAVLLRREIVKLDSSLHLQELIPHLLQAFVAGSTTSSNAPPIQRNDADCTTS